MFFDRSLRDLWQEAGDGWALEVPSGWGQGRTTFGGLMTALAASLAIRHVDPDWQLRTINVQFLRPAVPGSLTGHFAVNRAGKGTHFTEVRLSQADGPTLIAQLIFVRPRHSDLDVQALAMRPTRPWDTLDDLPFIPGMTPEFTQHLALRWADGGYPYSGADTASFTGYCRFRVPFGDAEGMLGLLDAWPVPSLSLAKGPAAASSIMWTAHLLSIPSDTTGWFGFEYDTLVGAHGLHTAAGRLFSPDGQLVGWTEQLVTVYA